MIFLSKAARCFLLAGALARASAAEPAADGAKPVEPPQGALSKLRDAVDTILPTSMQKRPTVVFNAITEMTPEGRKWRVPIPDNPIYYYSAPGSFVQTGWSVAAGERPPRAADMEEAMKKALAGNGYVPIGETGRRPDILVVFSFGSSGTDPAILADDSSPTPPITADELVPLVLSDPALFKDVFERARLVGGEKFARELKLALDAEVRNMNSNRSTSRLGGDFLPLAPVSPDFGSPYQVFVNSGNRQLMTHLAEMAFHTCYFVVATAFDFSGVEKKQKIMLWQTRMAVEAQGVSMEEILKPLIAATGSYLGRDTPEAVMVKKRIDREGKVEIGTATVVEEARPAAPAPQK